MNKFGIDISLYQKGLDMYNAKKEGVEYVIIKASEGNFVDPQFENHYKNAVSIGLGVGAYHFLGSKTIDGAKKEAKFFAQTLNGKKFDYPAFVDVEGDTLKGVSKANLTKIVAAFCDTMESLGYWAGFYTNLDWYRNRLDGATLAARYSFWGAYWGSECVFNDAQMWQFGGNIDYIRDNKIAGGVCDQDYCFKDFPSLIKAKGLNGYPKPTTTSPSKPSTPAKPTTPASPKVETLRVGDVVRLTPDAVVYGTTVPFLPFVYNENLYVREMSGDRIVISTNRYGAVTGAVDKKYLKKI